MTLGIKLPKRFDGMTEQLDTRVGSYHNYPPLLGQRVGTSLRLRLALLIIDIFTQTGLMPCHLSSVFSVASREVLSKLSSLKWTVLG